MIKSLLIKRTGNANEKNKTLTKKNNVTKDSLNLDQVAVLRLREIPVLRHFS